jgi:hypothetical protein
LQLNLALASDRGNRWSCRRRGAWDVRRGHGRAGTAALPAPGSQE